MAAYGNDKVRAGRGWYRDTVPADRCAYEGELTETRAERIY